MPHSDPFRESASLQFFFFFLVLSLSLSLSLAYHPTFFPVVEAFYVEQTVSFTPKILIQLLVSANTMPAQPLADSTTLHTHTRTHTHTHTQRRSHARNTTPCTPLHGSSISVMIERSTRDATREVAPLQGNVMTASRSVHFSQISSPFPPIWPSLSHASRTQQWTVMLSLRRPAPGQRSAPETPVQGFGDARSQSVTAVAWQLSGANFAGESKKMAADKIVTETSARRECATAEACGLAAQSSLVLDASRQRAPTSRISDWKFALLDLIGLRAVVRRC
ncbi:hypothetical protein BIW11_09672 [Tropilaelaps mercedesae]|uniref:Uncharacterized protein n=1 Tax=Tropilaelaps mercedesae TaxID=418985 RepID=A0A1V9XJJ5_9ACAR|nr:hypothetical protein BIW11_09672 [Tropilaelaps mercedesae]